MTTAYNLTEFSEVEILKDYIKERVTEVGKYIIETQSTIRKTAKQFKISKSTVHKDLSERLPYINPSLAAGAKRVMEKNKAERHLRGGKATKDKYNRAKEIVKNITK